MEYQIRDGMVFQRDTVAERCVDSWRVSGLKLVAWRHFKEPAPGIDVFEKPDMPSGAWELHEGDDVIDSGVLRFTVIPAEQEVDERLTND